MARSSPSTDVAMTMLRDLVEAQALAARLSETAPSAVALAGGVQQLIGMHGHRTGAWFWTIVPMPEALWVQMAEEHQAKHRANGGE